LIVETLLKTLGAPRRCDIVRLVWTDELAATEIAGHFPDVTRSAISQHLGVLRRTGLVNERRDGTRREFIDSFWTSRLERLRDLAESGEKKGSDR
jgi:DNA-binding transcriptional ArsR family regulator